MWSRPARLLRSNAEMDGEQKQIRILLALGILLVLAVFCFRLLSPAESGEVLTAGAPQSGTVSSSESESGGLVNVNTADRETLMTLPGIGETKARAIIDYRMQYGGFTSPGDLEKVKGIGSGIVDKIRDRIVFE